MSVHVVPGTSVEAGTAAERDRQLYDAQTATTIVLLALLRD